MLNTHFRWLNHQVSGDLPTSWSRLLRFLLVPRKLLGLLGDLPHWRLPAWCGLCSTLFVLELGLESQGHDNHIILLHIIVWFVIITLQSLQEFGAGFFPSYDCIDVFTHELRV